MCSEGIVERYVNFYTDFAFKKLFGTEINKELLYGNQQRTAHQFPQRPATRKGKNRGHYLPERRTPWHAGIRPARRVRCVLQEREGRTFHRGDAER